MKALDPKYDISATTLAKSDQLNADDIIGGPITVQVIDAYVVGGDQPVQIHLDGWEGRPYKPSKSMRKVLEFAWGRDMSIYPGRWMTLYRDPSVKYGGQEVGGIKISHLSHIDSPIKLALAVTRGKKAPHTVAPLTPPAGHGDRPEPATNTTTNTSDESPREQIKAFVCHAEGWTDEQWAEYVAWFTGKHGTPTGDMHRLDDALWAAFAEHLYARPKVAAATSKGEQE